MQTEKLKQYHRERQKLWYRKHCLKVRARDKFYKIKQRYGIDKQEFLSMTQKQNNQCAICEQTLEENKVYVDHNHFTKQARGLVCPSCNIFIGHVENRPHLITKIQDYLKRNQQ